MLKTVLLVLLTGVLVTAQPEEPVYFLEKAQVQGGAELVTLFGHLHAPNASGPDAAVPLLSVLRDTLGDGDSNNDRLRYVWILTSTRPTPIQRAASAMSVLVSRRNQAARQSRPIARPGSSLSRQEASGPTC